MSREVARLKVVSAWIDGPSIALVIRFEREGDEPIEVDTMPFDTPPPGALAKRAHWVEPRLVAEVQFTEWTGDGKIRHPSLQGFRTDKRPADVRRELAE